MDFTPRSDSAAARAVAFFTSNPDEELSADDVAAKLDISRASVHTLLKRAVDAGHLVRKRTDDGVYIYAAGDGRVKAPFPVATTPPPQRSPAARGAWSADAIAIEDGIPVPPATQTTGLATVLEKLQAGQSIKVPIEKKAVTSTAITATKKKFTGRKFTLRKLDAEWIRVWRVE